MAGAVLESLHLTPNVNLGRLIRQHKQREHATTMLCFERAAAKKRR